ncbi:HAD-IIA family hydrolase [Marinobacter fonticola]|uniref:HAD-IIA family hydrolase n=1 Tax=Marinobacter fonticola TaxID=2603215 RepID=UPI0011E71065|nr:HAD hydrolase-like protein [Marinobacter fonticola]
MNSQNVVNPVHQLMLPTPRWAFSEYERIRHRLPASIRPDRPAEVTAQPNLGLLADQFDAFVFDAYGVLNTGDRPLTNAVMRFAELQRAGKRCLILSNAATASSDRLLSKYRSFGFALDEDQLISSRWLLERALHAGHRQGLWGVIAPLEANPQTLPLNYVSIHGEPNDNLRDRMDRCDGFIFLSTHGWTSNHQAQLEASLGSYPRPVEVANPDLVAPRDDTLTLEPGFYAHRLIDHTGITPVFYGKPYGPAFQEALARLEGIEPSRTLMIGDTLHTDILGGQSAGMRTMLVTEHGSLKGLDVRACMERSGIQPDFVAPAI